MQFWKNYNFYNMKLFKHKNKTPHLGKFNWDHISINQYYSILDILEDDSLDGFNKNINICAVLTGESPEYFKLLSIEEASIYFSKLNFLNNPPRITTPPNTYNITYKGQPLKLKLSDIEHLTVSQFVDWNTLVASVSDPSNIKSLRDIIGNLLSIFLVPEDKSYSTGYDIDYLQEILLDQISFGTAQSILNFLLTKYLRLLKVSLRYLVREEKKRMKRNKMKEMESPEMKTSLGSIDTIKLLIHQIQYILTSS